MADADHVDAVAYLVFSIPDAKPRTVRVNITVPEMTLKQIDAAVKKGGCQDHPFSLTLHKTRFIQIIRTHQHSPHFEITKRIMRRVLRKLLQDYHKQNSGN